MVNAIPINKLPDNIKDYAYKTDAAGDKSFSLNSEAEVNNAAIEVKRSGDGKKYAEYCKIAKEYGYDLSQFPVQLYINEGTTVKIKTTELPEIGPAGADYIVDGILYDIKIQPETTVTWAHGVGSEVPGTYGQMGGNLSDVQVRVKTEHVDAKLTIERRTLPHGIFSPGDRLSYLSMEFNAEGMRDPNYLNNLKKAVSMLDIIVVNLKKAKEQKADLRSIGPRRPFEPKDAYERRYVANIEDHMAKLAKMRAFLCQCMSEVPGRTAI